MKNLILIFALVLLGGCSDADENMPESITDMTNQLISFKSQLVECDTFESCGTVSTDMTSYMIEVNHPDNDGQLCNKYAKCYEASVDLIEYGFSEEYLEKLASFLDASLFPN